LLWKSKHFPNGESNALGTVFLNAAQAIALNIAEGSARNKAVHLLPENG